MIDEGVNVGVVHEMAVVATVILDEHEVGSPEVTEEVLGVERTMPETLEGKRLLDELEGESGVGETGRTEPTKSSTGIELCAEYPGIESLAVYGENVGNELASEEERREVTRGTEGVDGGKLECNS